MPSLTKALEKRIQELKTSIESQRVEMAAYERVLEIELAHAGRSQQADTVETGEGAAFSTLKAGEAFVNLVASPEYEHQWWGRAIFRVDSVDAHYRLLCERGLQPPFPRDQPLRL